MTSTATIDQIARRHLGIETLAVRNNDSLDFHDVGVAGVGAALQAAFDAGQQSAVPRKSATTTGNYSETLVRVQTRLEQLARAVEAHAARQARELGHWGYVGDINALELLLAQALARVAR